MAGGWWTAAAAKTVGLALAVLGAALASAELAARSAVVRERLPAPSLGTPSRMLDLQLAGADSLVEEQGPIECLFLGNSLVLFGIDPDAFAEAFAAHGEGRLRCFNFAVPGIAVSGTAAIAGILAHDYRPRLVVYGVTPRDFYEAVDAPAVETTPWVRYRRGVATVDGWLADHSYAYRYFLMIVGGYLHDAPPIRRFAVESQRGFWASAVTTPLDAATTARAKELAVHQMSGATSDVQLQALDEVLALRAAGIQVAVVELPLHLPPAQWPPDAAAAYREVMARIARRTSDAGVPLWVPPADLIPDDDWIDVWHLNGRGAAIFGGWLGERAARAIERGEVRRPAAE